MSECVEREEGGVSSKSSLSGQHERSVHQDRAASPVSSCVSMKSDLSTDLPITFKDGHHSTEQRVHQQRAASPAPSCVSMKSDWSMGRPINFKDGHQSTAQRFDQQRAASPVPSCVSMNSDWSMGRPINFKDGHQSTEQRVHQQRAASPAPSCVSMKSDWSMGRPINFKDGHQSTAQRFDQQRAASPVPSCVSMNSDWSMGRPINFKDGHQSTEKRVHQQRAASPVPSCVSLKSDASKGRLMNVKDDSTDQRVHQQRAASPVPSCVSMSSDWSMGRPINFNYGHQTTEQRVDQQIAEYPVPSCVSMKSDWSMGRPINFNYGHQSTEQSRRNQQRGRTRSRQEKRTQERKQIKQRDQQSSQDVIGQSAQERPTELDSIFKLLKENVITSVENELERFKRVLQTPDYLECLESPREGGVVDSEEEQRRNVREGVLNISLNLLRILKQEEMADILQSKTLAARYQRHLKSIVKKKFRCLSEWITKQENPTVLKKIFTELFITVGGRGEVNQEHEVRQIETASRKPSRPETPITFEDIFKSLPGEQQSIRTVMTKGVAGIGKTVLTQMYAQDWASDEANHNVHFVFPFTFRALNLVKEKNYSLVDLLHHFFGKTNEAEISSFKGFQVVFIFDGLDECRIPLHFQTNEILTDVTKPTSVGVLVTNLIKGNLLPSALIWITTRPAAANLVPSEYVDRTTEVRGFTDPQKEIYFMKRFSDDENQARTITSHIQTSRSLHIMCHIPVFCWITAAVLENMLKTEEKGALPKTQTAMYIHFMVIQSKQKQIKYETQTPEAQVISVLAKLAFEQLQKGHLIFYEADLMESGIDIRAASVYSGVFTQVFKEEHGLYEDRVFCFVHLSVQEFLAALHVYGSFIHTGVNQLSNPQTPSMSSECDLDLLYQSAVNKATKSPNGHWDLFLRFLLGLSLETNQILLQRLFGETGSKSQTSQKTVKYIKEKIRENPSPERSVNLFHCLNELNDHSLEEEVQQYVSSGSLSTAKLSPSQWSALVFILLSSGKELDVFDLKKYQASEEALLGLLPVVKASNKALLSGCNLSETCCDELSSLFSSNSSSLKEMDLSNNELTDSGVKKLSAGLGSPECTLETLRLSGCNLSETCCDELSSLLCSNSSSLKEIDLSNNKLTDSGVRKLSEGLGSPDCTLETLSLSGCQVSKEGCSSLLSALTSNPSHLRELDLRGNDLGSGVKQLSARLEDPNCGLEFLGVDDAVLMQKSAARKYSCSLSLDVNTVSNYLVLSEEDRKVTGTYQPQVYPVHPERFTTYLQVLSKESLCEGGRSYWEVEWSGSYVRIAVCYKDTNRQGDESWFGDNSKSWCLLCYDGSYTFRHNNVNTAVSGRCPSIGGRVGVYLDHSAGTLSFYSVTDTMTLLHTEHTTFTQPLYAGIACYYVGDTAELCKMW